MAPIPDDLVAFKLTAVFYEQGDAVFGRLMAAVSLIPIFMVVVLATLVVSRRDVGTIVLLVGQLVNDVLNRIAKKVIAEPRPPSVPPFAPGTGMPSNHAQFVGFLAMYTCLCLLRKTRGRDPPPFSFLLSGAAFLGGLLVCVSRVYLHYHTTPQVVAGFSCGCIVAQAWFRLMQWLRPSLSTWVVESRVGKWLRVRDFSNVHDVIEKESLLPHKWLHGDLVASRHGSNEFTFDSKWGEF